MKRKLLLLPMFMLVLAACGTSSSETPSVSEPISEVPVTSEEPVSEDPITSEDPVTSEVPVTSEDPVTSEVPVTSEEPVTSDDVPPPPPTSSTPVVQVTRIGDARKLDANTTVTVEGVITAIYGMASNTNAIILQDGDYAITMSFVDRTASADLAKGDIVRATGKISPFNGLIQLSGAAFTKLSSGADPVVPHVLTEADWTVENLEDMDGRIVKVEGLKYVSGTVNVNANSPITVKLGSKELPIYISNYISLTEKEALKAKFDAMNSYDTVTFVGPLGQYNDMQLNPVSADTVTIVAGEPPVGPVLPTALAFTPASVELAPEATFQTVLTKTPNDATLDGLVYASTNEAVATVSATGLVTAVAPGVANITATVGEVSANFMVTVSIITTEKVWGIDFKTPTNWVSDDKSGDYYSYSNTYNVVLKDGDVEMGWLLRGSNPNNLPVEGVRFGSKSTNAKLNAVITTGLPMEETLAAELSAVFAQSKEVVDGNITEVVVNIGGAFGAANFTRDKVYLQASTTADFATPINLGSKDANDGKLVFELESGLEDHFFRVIFGIKNNTTSNSGLLVSSITFNKDIETPEAPKAKVGLTNLLSDKVIDDLVTISEGYVLWNRYTDTTMAVGTPEGIVLVSYYAADAGLKSTFETVVKGDYVNMTLKVAANGTGGNFARANIGIPQVVESFLFVKVALPTWQFDGMTEATNVYDLTQGLNWLAGYGTADLGTYVRVTGKVVEAGNGNQFYLEFNTRVEGMNATGTGTNYIRLSAYKADLMGFTLEVGKTYTIEGIIGGVNQNLPLTGTTNPIFRLYAQSVVEVTV